MKKLKDSGEMKETLKDIDKYNVNFYNYHKFIIESVRRIN